MESIELDRGETKKRYSKAGGSLGGVQEKPQGMWTSAKNAFLRYFGFQPAKPVVRVDGLPVRFPFDSEENVVEWPMLQLLPVEKPLAGKFKHFSQDGEDLYAYEHFFYNVKGGVFVELGALDGVMYANSLFFEKNLGWRGVLIEASSKNFPNLIQNRPSAVCVQSAVCDRHRLVHFVEHANPCCGGVAEFMTPDFIQKFHPQMNISKLPVIPCLPLSEILEQFDIVHVQFLSLDVEGAEMMVLRTINFGRIRFDVLVVEAQQNEDAPVNDEIEVFMASKGYDFHGTVARNKWFVHPSFRARAKPHVTA